MARRKKYKKVKGLKRPKRLKKPSADRARRALMSAALGWHVCSTVLEKIVWRTKHQMETMMGLKVLKPVFFIPLIIAAMPMLALMMPAFCLAQCVTTLQSVVSIHIIKDRYNLIVAERRGVFDKFNEEKAARMARSQRKKSSTMEWVRKSTGHLRRSTTKSSTSKDTAEEVAEEADEEGSVGSQTVDTNSSCPSSVASKTSASVFTTKSSSAQIQRPLQPPPQEQLRGSLMASMRQQTMRLVMGDMALEAEEPGKQLLSRNGATAEPLNRPNLVQMRAFTTSSIASGNMDDLDLALDSDDDCVRIEETDDEMVDKATPDGESGAANSAKAKGTRDVAKSSSSDTTTENIVVNKKQPMKRSKSLLVNPIRRMRSFNKRKDGRRDNDKEGDEDLDATAGISNYKQPPRRSKSLGLVNPIKLRRNNSKKNMLEVSSIAAQSPQPSPSQPRVRILSSLAKGSFHGSGFDLVE